MAKVAGSLDSNVLLRLILKDVPEQHIAAVKLLEHSSGGLHVADTALIESAFVLEREYQFTRAQIAATFDDIMTLSSIHCNRVLLQHAAQLFLANPSLSFEDCCLATYAILNDAEPLWTFDRKLSVKAPSARLVPKAKGSSRL